MKRLALLPAFALMGCTMPQHQETPAIGTGRCDADAAKTLVGKPYDKALGDKALAKTGARTLRVIRPGMAVTMDYRTDRLNIDIDDQGVVTRIHCG